MLPSTDSERGGHDDAKPAFAGCSTCDDPSSRRCHRALSRLRERVAAIRPPGEGLSPDAPSVPFTRSLHPMTDRPNASATASRAHVLLVEDEESLRRGLTAVLGASYRVTAVGSGEEGLRALDRELFDLVLLELSLPGISGLDVLSAARSLQTDAQCLMMTGFGSVDAAVDAMKLGAYDFLNKPVAIPELLVKLERALAERDVRREVAQLRSRTETGTRGRILGRAPVMERLFTRIERVAPTRASVLVVGETGTGKELVARAIHDLSDRARRPFIPVNCSALPETLLESELFGHVKGAFTGAIASKRGLFEEAHGGTIFLDEIATVSAAIQVKLLRVLQERQVQRVGGGGATAVDFRLVAACNVDLAEEVRQGRFREDLFYRLNVFPVHVPPLRERREDVPVLANHFRARFARENGVEPPEIAAPTLRRMMEYDWPGNVRELENTIERAVILHAGATTLPFELPRGPSEQPAADVLARAGQELWDLDRVEREYILTVLERTGGHQGRTAEILGIDVRTLSRKMTRWRDEGAVPAHVGV